VLPAGNAGRTKSAYGVHGYGLAVVIQQEIGSLRQEHVIRPRSRAASSSSSCFGRS